MLAHPEVDVARHLARADAPVERQAAELRAVAAREVGRAADQVRDGLGQRVQHGGAGLARGHALGAGLELGQVRVPAFRQALGERDVQLSSQLREGRAVRCELRVPGRLVLGACGHGGVTRGAELGGHVEGLLGPAHDGLGGLDLGGSERRAVGRGGVLLGGRRETDDGLHADQAGARVGLGLARRGQDGLDVLAVVHTLGMPAVGAVARQHVLGERDVRAAVDRDAVVIPVRDDLPELQVPGHGGGLGRDALHQVSVGRDDPHLVVEQRVPRLVEARREELLGHGHADRVGDALPERTGGDLHARRVVQLGVPRRLAVPLAELLDVVQREVVAREVQQRVLQHGRVAAGQDEAVTVGPLGRDGVVLAQLGEDRPAQRRERHRGPWVPGVGGLHRVHGEAADGVDGESVEGGLLRHVMSPEPVDGPPSAVGRS